MKVSQPNDPAEIEADQVADKVIRTSESVSINSSHTKLGVQPKLSSPGGGESTGGDISNRINASRGGGKALDPSTRHFMENRFGTDFGQVRIHTGIEATEFNRQVSANAFTVGSDIFFSQGQYRPESDKGMQLLAHELAHTVQQKNRSTIIQRQAIPDDLKLPCKWGNYSLEDNKIGSIRIPVGMAAAERESLPPLKDIAAQIEKDNKIISDPKFQVKTCIISNVTTRFALYKGEPVLMINATPEDANVETVAHEMGHAVFHFMRHNKGTKINKLISSDDAILNLADIFLQLEAITLTADDKSEFTANWLVDPSFWNPGAAKEHPTDPDEFFASAKAAYQLNKKKLEAIFAKYGKLDKNVAALGKRLLALLAVFFSGGKLTSKPTIGSDKTAIDDEIKGISEPSLVEKTISSPLNTVVRKLLDPDDRMHCK